MYIKDQRDCVMIFIGGSTRTQRRDQSPNDEQNPPIQLMYIDDEDLDAEEDELSDEVLPIPNNRLLADVDDGIGMDLFVNGANGRTAVHVDPIDSEAVGSNSQSSENSHDTSQDLGTGSTSSNLLSSSAIPLVLPLFEEDHNTNDDSEDESEDKYEADEDSVDTDETDRNSTGNDNEDSECGENDSCSVHSSDSCEIIGTGLDTDISALFAHLCIMLGFEQNVRNIVALENNDTNSTETVQEIQAAQPSRIIETSQTTEVNPSSEAIDVEYMGANLSELEDKNDSADFILSIIEEILA